MTKTTFFEALQSNPIVIDSDVVGAARLLWQARALELNIDTKLVTKTYLAKGNMDELREKIDKVFRDLAFRSPFRNLFEHSARGVLYYAMWGVSLTGVECTTQEQYLPQTQVELSYFSSRSPIFTLRVHHLVADEGHPWTKQADNLLNAFAELGLEENPVIITKTDISGENLVHTHAQLDATKLGRDSFYPTLPVPLNEYIDAYLADTAQVLVIMGPPGTAKSTLIRTIIHRSKVNALVCASEKAVASGGVIAKVKEGEYGILAVEDVDNLLGSRREGNSFMSTLLNEGDGIAKSEFKIIISANLADLADIDSALLRDGRTFDVLYLGDLSVDQAKAVAADMNITFRDLNQDRYTVAKVFAMDRPEFTLFSKRKGGAKIGFGASR